MPAPTVSVTICLHNAAGYIRDTLASLFAQTRQDWEAIVVDDGSTDGSADLITREFRDRRIKIVRQRQQTLRIARPVSIAHSTGEFFAILDSDDLWAPDKLERQIAAARQAPDAGLIFTDCRLVNALGHPFGRLSDQFDYRRIDMSAGRAHLELLKRGDFVGISTAMVPMWAMRMVGGFNYSYQYVSDYDLWLRLGRRLPFAFVNAPLADYRIHETQFTQRHPEITLPETRDLLTPILHSASYPQEVRTAIGDNLLGQHRVAWRQLLAQRRYRLAAVTALGLLRYPGRIRDSIRHRLGRTWLGRPLEAVIGLRHWLADISARSVAVVRNEAHRVNLLARAALGHLVRLRPVPTETPGQTHVWIDGTSLGREQTGYFNLLTELIRRLLADGRYVLHVQATPNGRAALLARLGVPRGPLHFHRVGWRSLHWTQIFEIVAGAPVQLIAAIVGVMAFVAGSRFESRWLTSGALAAMLAQVAVLVDLAATATAAAAGRGRHSYLARATRYAWRRWPAPRWRSHQQTIEVLFWRGRFRFKDATHIAIVQDLTTRTHPHLHTEGNVREFDEFLGYAQRYARSVLTVSNSSRLDIVDRIAVSPAAVSVIPMPIHPQYESPQFDPGVPALHNLTQPYVLCVGALEPRKNLRRVVKAFEMIKSEQAASETTLVIAGPPAWDPEFGQFLTGSDAAPRIRVLGFVPLEHLPSLYHYASAVIAASLYEGFGIPVMEAMCSSAVVMASRAGSLPEVLGPNGVLFDPYSTEDIAASMLGALSLSPEQEDAYRRRCRARATEHLARVAAADYLTPVQDQHEAAIAT